MKHVNHFAMKSIALVIVCTISMGVYSQGFLKKVQKGITKTTTTEQCSASEKSSKENSKELPDSVKEAVTNIHSFTVNKVIEKDKSGKILVNKDGTTIYHYLIIDKDGKVCDANTAKKIVASRNRSILNILAKVGVGTAAGAGVGFVSGGTSGAIAGGAAGAAVGLALSAPDIKNLKEQNKKLEEYKNLLNSYKTTFTEEGIPLDAKADLSNVNGIDFSKSKALTKSAAEVKSELAASKKVGEKMPDIN